MLSHPNNGQECRIGCVEGRLLVGGEERMKRIKEGEYG
jgi:hypothetical protein